MKVLLIHGEKPLRNKALHPAFEQRLKLAVILDKTNDYDLIIISGGQTRQQFPAESIIGYEYLKNQISTSITQESQSKTIIENINFSKNILQRYEIDRLDIVISQSKQFRTEYLWRNLWPDVYPRCKFYGALDNYFFLLPVLELFYFLYSMLDIKEAFLPKITKRIFRNN